MTKLDEMWVDVADYQSIADDKGHGDTWAEMCRLRTVKACLAASRRPYLDVYACYAANTLAYATNAAGYGDAATAEYWMQEAIDFINKAQRDD